MQRDCVAPGVLQSHRSAYCWSVSTKALLLVKRALPESGKLPVFFGLEQSISLGTEVCTGFGQTCYPHNA
jgi:hypothetical protein